MLEYSLLSSLFCLFFFFFGVGNGVEQVLLKAQVPGDPAENEVLRRTAIFGKWT